MCCNALHALHQRSLTQPVRRLASLRLDRFRPALELLGVEVLADLREVTEADCEAAGFARLHLRRYSAAAAELPAEDDEAPAADAPVAEWLHALRLQRFGPALQRLGVEEAADLSECTSADLDAMGMPCLAQRRLRAAAPPSDGAGAARAAGARAAGAPPGARLAEWLSALRLPRYLPHLQALGASEVEDAAEVTADELTEVGMRELQARRFALAAARAAQRPGGPPLPPPAALAAAAAAAAAQAEPRAWLAALRLAHIEAALAALGVEAACDCRELSEADLAPLRLPRLQRRRLAAAQRATPPPPPPSRRHSAAAEGGDPEAWLACARLAAFAPAARELGAERASDLAELLVPQDLDALGMATLHRRRFLAARCALPPPPPPPPPEPQLLSAAPAAWLAACRCDAYAAAFARLGALAGACFAEVLLADLEAIGLPLLHSRRFAAAAAATAAALRAAGAAPEEQRARARGAATAADWLACLRLQRHAAAFEALGVERVHDFAEVVEGDLREVGLSVLELRRWRAALQDLRED